jgi:hypothetical protein
VIPALPLTVAANATDCCERRGYKPVAFVSYGGTGCGARAVEQWRNVAVEVRMVPVRGEVNIRLIGLQTDDAGRPTDPLYGKFAAGMIDQLLWWARAMKAARAAETPPGRSPSSAREEIRRRVDGWRAAERREREAREAEGSPPPSVALQDGLELCLLDPLSPGSADPVREREDELVRAAWDRLRRGLGWQRSAPARL